MSYQPELLTTAASLEELELLLQAGADAFVIGESKYGSRLAGEFTLDMIEKAIKLAHAGNAKVYVSMNNLMDNAVVEELPEYITALDAMKVDAIVYGDPSVLMTVREYAPNMKLHWNAEMTSTNFATAEYWAKRGTSRFVLARELNMDQIIDTKQKTNVEIQVQVHGMTAIYHSKRGLLKSYGEHRSNNERLAQIEDAKGLYLMEDDRPDERFPIFEDDYGTHIMSSDDICMLENMNELLDVKVESFKIEGLLKSMEYNVAVVSAYRKVIDLYLADPEAYQFDEAWLETIRKLQDPGRELSFGFFFKEQVY